MGQKRFSRWLGVGRCVFCKESHSLQFVWNILINSNAMLNIKPRPNNRNMPTQHVATLLGATCMLRAFGHRVATCCDMLGVVGSILTSFKLEPITPNMSQHIATRWPNAHTKLRPTMLRYVALTCCDRLAGALKLI